MEHSVSTNNYGDIVLVNELVSNSTIPYHLAQYCARLGQVAGAAP